MSPEVVNRLVRHLRGYYGIVLALAALLYVFGLLANEVMEG
jgi:hypothetical protein